MVSVALLTREHHGPIPRDEWNLNEQRLASRAARAALAGVGESKTDDWSDGSIAIFVRRQCTDQERRQVPERYLNA